MVWLVTTLHLAARMVWLVTTLRLTARMVWLVTTLRLTARMVLSALRAYRLSEAMSRRYVENMELSQ